MTEDWRAALTKAVEALAAAPKVALACHVNPDPDALGSMLGLAGFLAARGTEVVCSWGNDPFDVPRWMAALDGSGSFVVHTPAVPLVCIGVDIGDQLLKSPAISTFFASANFAAKTTSSPTCFTP